MTTDYKMMPEPDDDYEKVRWTEVSQRKRLLMGNWTEDLKTVATRLLPKDRIESWKFLDESFNLYKNVIQQISQVYGETPNVSGRKKLSSARSETLEKLNVFRYHRKLNIFTNGLGEMLVYLDWSPGNKARQNGELFIELVYPDELEIEDNWNAPGVPVKIRRLQYRELNDIGCHWCWTEFDLLGEDDENGIASGPQLRIKLAEAVGGYLAGEDVTAKATDFDPTWRWIDSKEQPFLPFVVYHRETTSDLWERNPNHELLCGTYVTAILWSFFTHVIKDVCWAQRWAINLKPAGLSPSESGLQQRVSTDPGSILLFEAINSEIAGLLGSFDRPVDPKNVQDAIVGYQMSLVSTLGINPSDQVAVAQPQSGISLTIKRDSVKQIIQAQHPLYMKSDAELLSKIAAIWNMNKPVGEADLPEERDFWVISYSELPLSADEQQAKIDKLMKLIELTDMLVAKQIMDPDEQLSKLKKASENVV